MITCECALVIHLLPGVGKGLPVALLPPQLLLLLCPQVLTPHLFRMPLLPSTDELMYLGHSNINAGAVSAHYICITHTITQMQLNLLYTQ